MWLKWALEGTGPIQCLHGVGTTRIVLIMVKSFWSPLVVSFLATPSAWPNLV